MEASSRLLHVQSAKLEQLLKWLPLRIIGVLKRTGEPFKLSICNVQVPNPDRLVFNANYTPEVGQGGLVGGRGSQLPH